MLWFVIAVNMAMSTPNMEKCDCRIIPERLTLNGRKPAIILNCPLHESAYELLAMVKSFHMSLGNTHENCDVCKLIRKAKTR